MSLGVSGRSRKQVQCLFEIHRLSNGTKHSPLCSSWEQIQGADKVKCTSGIFGDPSHHWSAGVPYSSHISDKPKHRTPQLPLSTVFLICPK